MAPKFLTKVCRRGARVAESRRRRRLDDHRRALSLSSAAAAASCLALLRRCVRVLDGCARREIGQARAHFDSNFHPDLERKRRHYLHLRRTNVAAVTFVRNRAAWRSRSRLCSRRCHQRRLHKPMSHCLYKRAAGSKSPIQFRSIIRPANDERRAADGRRRMR